MKPLRHCIVMTMLFSVFTTQSALADEPLPEYIRKAQTLIGQAEGKATELNDYADDVLIGRNYLRNAEGEYKKNLGWSGKLDQKAEPTVRYYASMAQLQAAIVLARAGKIDQEKERVRLEGLAAGVKAKIKVFDDKNAQIAALKAEIAKRDNSIADLNKQIAGLNTEVTAKAATKSSSEQKVAVLTGEVQTLKWSLSKSEQKASELAIEADKQKKSVEDATAEIARLKGELAAVVARNAQKDTELGKSQEQTQALNRSQQFVADVGKLGGVMKIGSNGITAIFSRTSLIKASAKSVTVTPEGEKLGLALAELLRNYQEYRAAIKVHGFGQPAKSEDAAATDQMARLLREVAIGKGKLDPADVEALGVGQSDSIYPKSNPEGNRRVEIAFVKKQTK
ncbi:MAG: hypothetical protein HYV06_00925 [Deltaproteobacteria bacterium]|nr:hypothetical protein [Deltaproteobacteria bacterium]